MKKILLILLSVMLVAGCCKTEPPVVEKTRGLHYFYVDNRTDEEFGFTTSAESNEDTVPSEFPINKYMDVHIYPNAKTLIRVFATDDALDLFYYSEISPYIFDFFRKETIRSKTIWKAEYWKYNQYEEWKSEYVMVVTPELLNDLF